MKKPYKKAEYYSDLDYEAFINELEKITSRTKKYSEGKLFIGSIDKSQFRIERIIKYRNSMLPTIRGDIEPTNDKILLTLTFQLDPFVKWLLGFSFCVYVIVLMLFVLSDMSLRELLSNIALVIVCYIIVMLGFSPEVKIAEDQLIDRLKLKAKNQR